MDLRAFDKIKKFGEFLLKLLKKISYFFEK